jgi:hypothetical protein
VSTSTKSTPQAFIGTEVVAERLAVPLSWLYNGADRAGLPVYYLGQRRRYVWDEVAAWLVGNIR